jgi:predicted nucleic acid-binding protein
VDTLGISKVNMQGQSYVRVMVVLDTNISIYVLNADSQFEPAAATLMKTAQQPKLASELVFAEILESPKLKNTALQNKVISFLSESDITWRRITKEILFEVARLRCQHPYVNLPMLLI